METPPILSKEQLQKLYQKYKKFPKERQKIKKMQKEKRFRKSSRMKGIGIGLTTPTTYCTKFPEQCGALMEELFGNAPKTKCD